jgi:hypothetical protein
VKDATFAAFPLAAHCLYEPGSFYSFYSFYFFHFYLLIKSGGVGILDISYTASLRIFINSYSQLTSTAIRQPSRRTLGLNLNQYSTSELRHLQKSIRIRSNYFL